MKLTMSHELLSSVYKPPTEFSVGVVPPPRVFQLRSFIEGMLDIAPRYAR
jgi:hypothetical protein